MDEIRRHSVEEFPNECCGVVIADADAGGQRVMRMRNIQDEMHAKDPQCFARTARTAYLWHPSDHAALDAALAAGSSLVAFYHSHPDHDAYFSSEDSAAATPFGEPSYPQALQVVVSIYGREVGTIKAFAWSEQERAYVECAFEEK